MVRNVVLPSMACMALSSTFSGTYIRVDQNKRAIAPIGKNCSHPFRDLPRKIDIGIKGGQQNLRVSHRSLVVRIVPFFREGRLAQGEKVLGDVRVLIKRAQSIDEVPAIESLVLITIKACYPSWTNQKRADGGQPREFVEVNHKIEPLPPQISNCAEQRKKETQHPVALDAVNILRGHQSEKLPRLLVPSHAKNMQLALQQIVLHVLERGIGHDGSAHLEELDEQYSPTRRDRAPASKRRKQPANNLPYIPIDKPQQRRFLHGLGNGRRLFVAHAFDKEKSDPNGIRTRVTAVKGRCPRPLDDRVTRAGQYRNWLCCCKQFTPEPETPGRLLRTSGLSNLQRVPIESSFQFGCKSEITRMKPKERSEHSLFQIQVKVFGQ
jgi:hypothetical protein